MIWGVPVFAQYAGPAILSRGEAPSAMSGRQIEFSPFVSFNGTYSSGLSNVSVDSSGALANDSAYGMSLGWGVSGAHSWRYTHLGLYYAGSASHYPRNSFFDNLNQSFMLGVTHQLKRHVSVSSRTSAGIMSRDSGLRGLRQTVPFDPTATYVPTTDFFDNRTIYLTSGASVIFQKTARLSFSLGADGFIVRRRSQALNGVYGMSANADTAYRVSRRSTIGALYMFGHFEFTRAFGGSDYHGVAAAYSIQLSRYTELATYVGAYRVESKFIQNVAIDPAIAALLGITSASRIVHTINYLPHMAGRLSRTFQRGVAYVSAGRSVTPGNGLFLTSIATQITGGYTYTGLRYWSLSAMAGHDFATALGHIQGTYRSTYGAVSASRELTRSIHMMVSYSLRQYNSPTYTGYSRTIQSASIGLGYSPGNIPLRMW
jgi:hypothetical protein